MLVDVDIPHLTLLFCGTVIALAVALVWLICELDRRFGKRITARALVRFGYLPNGRRNRHPR
jgi:hypothetical protein